MSNTCVLCRRTIKVHRRLLTKIASVEVENKIKQAYEDKNGIPLSRSILNAIVHRGCYAKHHFRYGYSLNRKRPSRKASNHRFPLSNVTNNQDLTSSFTGIVSTDHHPKEKPVVDLDFDVESTSNSWSTASFLTNPNKTVIFSLILYCQQKNYL